MEKEKEKDEDQNLINGEIKTASDVKTSQPKIVRGAKKMRIDTTEPNQLGEKRDGKDDEEVKIGKSLKRSCELWSLEDKNTFFKAVNEYGKDFDAIQTYFLNQGKKKGLTENLIKNKEQIRHFYYRSWSKISKNLKFSEDVKKTSQEIYGLINYGELRRKLPRIHEKVLLKLNELIYWGTTQVRLRGKTMRIKTPICRALRKLNQLEDWQEEIKLPPRITIELRPGNNLTWWKVQAHAMNPRVQTLLPIQRRLSSLLIFLQQRWKPIKYTNTITINDTNNINNLSKDNNELLRVAPFTGCKITLPRFNLGEYLTSDSVSFNSYEQRLSLKSSKVQLLGQSVNQQSVKKSLKKKTAVNNKLQSNNTTTIVTDDSSDKLINNNYTNNFDFDMLDNNLDKNNSHNINNNNINSNNNLQTDKTTSININFNEQNRFPGRETIDRIRQGWNVDEANSITIGDLYLMFGKDSKITLEYWWDAESKENNDGSLVEHSLNNNTKNQDNNNISLSLQKLLSIAKHAYSSNKMLDNNSSSNETVISTRVHSAKEPSFRRPLIPQTYHRGDNHDAFKTQLDKFTNRFCKRGRTVRQRNLIVQKTVPLIGSLNREGQKDDRKTCTATSINRLNDDIEMEFSNDENINDNDKDFLPALNEESKPSNSIITSATQILKEGESQWLNSEVADYSLSSFLVQFESPIKAPQRSQEEDTRPSSDVLAQMQCLMGENSVDYMTNFANLASQIASDGQQMNKL